MSRESSIDQRLYVQHSSNYITSHYLCLNLKKHVKKSADQPAHPRSLISTLVIRLLESIIS